MNDKTFVVYDKENEDIYFESENEEEASAALLDLVNDGVAAYMVTE